MHRGYALLALCAQSAAALKLVFAGGTGGVGSALAERCAKQGHTVTILCRNAYLAVSPSRISEDFGWVGLRRVEEWEAQGFGNKVTFRDWTGGDELDSVSNRWVGWEEALAGADAVVFAVGDLGRSGRTRPIDAIARAAQEAGESMPRRFVHLAPVDELVKRTGAFADKRIDTLAACENTWQQIFGSSGRSLRAGTVLGLPKSAESRLFPAPKDLRRVNGPWVHLDDLTDAVLEACRPDANGSGAPVLVEPSKIATLDAAKARPARTTYYL